MESSRNARRILVTPQRSVDDYVLLVLNMLELGEEVELHSAKENACMLADVVNAIIRESGGRAVQAGGGICVERLWGRRRTMVYVKLRLQG
ncbi:hypothetical protein [Stetteria hydrogenophila]